MMEVLYTEIELIDKKYADLLKIAKNLGLKSGRQKTSKLISAILERQDGRQVCLNNSESHADQTVTSSSTAAVSPSPSLAALERFGEQTNEDDSEDSILDVDEMLQSGSHKENDTTGKLDLKTSLAESSKEKDNKAASLCSPHHMESKTKAPTAQDPGSQPSKRRRSSSSEPQCDSPKRKIRKTRSSIAYGPSLTTAKRRPRRRVSAVPSSDNQKTAKTRRLKEPEPDLKEDGEENESSVTSGTNESSSDAGKSPQLNVSFPEIKSSSSASPDQRDVSSSKRVSSASKKAKKSAKKGKKNKKKVSSSELSPKTRLSSTPEKSGLNMSKTSIPLDGLPKITSSVTPRSANTSVKTGIPITVKAGSVSRKSASALKDVHSKSTSSSPELPRLTSLKSVPTSQKKSPSENPTPKSVKATRSATHNSPSLDSISVLDGSKSKSPALLKRDASFIVESSQSPTDQNTSVPRSSDSPSAVRKSGELSKNVMPHCLPGISSAQSKRLSEARRLSSPRVQRVEPTYAKPVFTIGRKEESNTESASKPNGTRAGNKSSIPRFMAYAQKIKKMPNFKRIHEKAFDTMQNIDEFVAKKKKLAESVTKAKRASSGFVPSVTTPTKLKLNFSATPRGANSPVVRFGAPAIQTPPVPKAAIAKTEPQSAHKSAVKENIKPAAATPRASTTSTWGAGPGLRRCSTATPRSALKARNTASSSTKHVSTTVTKSQGQNKTRLIDRESTYNADGARSAGRTSVIAGSVKRSASICKPVFSSSKMSNSSSARKSTLNRTSSSVAATDDTKPSLGGSKLPRYQFSAGAPASHSIRKLAGKKPPLVSQAERRAETQDFIKGVRTNKRFRLQMERRGINI